jgi:hypothetical protein
MIPPAEACSRGRQAYIDTIPEELQDEICKCKTVPDHLVYNQTKKLPDTGEVGIVVHVRCGKPANLWAYLEECYNCEYIYVVREYPDKNLICSECG